MSTTLAVSALLMGIAGGPHCAAMCGAACAGVTRADRGGASRGMWIFQCGRLAGYMAAGAAAAFAVQSFAWLTSNASVLRPVWTLFHLAVLLWGLTLLVLARQPTWAGGFARSVWSRVRPAASMAGGVFSIGALWVFMPCGLLYSALLAASLSGGPMQGALAMGLFAAGSGLSLVAAPLAFARLLRFRQEWGTRAAGAVLAGVSAWALWADVAHRVAVWCGIAS